MTRSTQKYKSILDVPNLAVREVADVRTEDIRVRVFEVKYLSETYSYALCRPMGQGLAPYTLHRVRDTNARELDIIETLTLTGETEWGAGYRWTEMIGVAAHLMQASTLFLDECRRERRRKDGQRNAGRQLP